MSNRRNRRLLLVVLATALAAAGCTSGSDKSATPAPSEIRIGLLAPMTGTNKQAGQDAQRGALLAADVVNGLNSLIPLPLAESSGLPNLGNARIRIVTADTRGDKDVASRATIQLATDQHVSAIVGAYDPDVTLAASQRAEGVPIPFINGDTSLSYLTDRGLNWFFHLGPTVRDSGQAFVSLMKTLASNKDNPNGAQAQGARPRINTRIGVLYGVSGKAGVAASLTGNDVAAVVGELANEGGFEVRAVPYDADNATDLSAQVGQLQAFNPDTVFVAPTASTVSLMVQAFGERSYKPNAIMAYGTGYISDEELQAAGPATAGICRETAWSPELAQRNAAALPVANLYQSKFNTKMTEEAADSFTAVLTTAIAINNARSTDLRLIRSALLSLNIPGDQTIMPWTSIRFDETHQNTGAASVIEQFLNRTFRPVFPLDSAGNNKLVFPASLAP
jgi:branched-chain amino acid transport system substrate-binding protein